MPAETVTLANLPAFATRIAAQIKPGDVIALNGQVAAGKTTLTKAILQGLGYAGRVNSPTFVLERHYQLDHPTIQTIVHLDFYRLSPEQINSFGWQDHLGQPGIVTIIEWPERAAAGLPEQVKTVTIKSSNEKNGQPGKSRRFILSDNFSD